MFMFIACVYEAVVGSSSLESIGQLHEAHYSREMLPVINTLLVPVAGIHTLTNVGLVSTYK